MAGPSRLKPRDDETTVCARNPKALAVAAWILWGIMIIAFVVYAATTVYDGYQARDDPCVLGRQFLAVTRTKC
jgi:hypothetical protein